jgi:2,4-dienoyl-CoA reductase-like NADH-dependent reductase (Old Yellow Enzyme family)
MRANAVNTTGSPAKTMERRQCSPHQIQRLFGYPAEDHTLQAIFTPVRVGRYTVPNRLVMAPMTRSRAKPDGTHSDIAAEYYSQRASVGLIVTEGTQPSADGQGYLATPGIYTPAHIAGWKNVTEAVHDKSGRTFIQIMHVGRMSHPDNTPHHRQGVSSSAIAPGTPMFTATGMQDIPTPRALSIDEVRKTVADFRHAARCAMEAGADGVEIHGANGYLVQQFLASNANTRTDDYGGSIANRARFAIEVAAAMAEEIGADRTAIRLSPGLTMWGIDEGVETEDLYRYLVAELDKLGLAYVHVIDQGNERPLSDIRALWKRSLILNRAGRPRDKVGSDVTLGLADLESYGQMVLANPDFVARLKAGAPMNAADRASFLAAPRAATPIIPRLAAP